MKTDFFVHESSYVDEGATVGAGTKIWHFCHVFGGAVIGSQCKLGQNVVVHATVRIGDRVKVQNNVSIYDGVELEDDVFCGPSVVFTNIRRPRSFILRNSPEDFERTLVRRGATIGANATIVCGLTVGQYAFVGAGALVTRDVADFQLVLGNPAQPAGWVCRCGATLGDIQKSTICPDCSSRYTLRDGSLVQQEPGGRED